MSRPGPGAQERPLQVAAVGSGPSGASAAGHLRPRDDVVRVDMLAAPGEHRDST